MIYEFKIPDNINNRKKENDECEIIDFISFKEAKLDEDLTRLERHVASVLESLGPIEFVHYDTYSSFLNDYSMNKYGFYIPTEDLQVTYTMEDTQ